ncbi:MAG: formylglycine-generating enzyme family protein [Rubripirellula sp.]|nr:formylglycine-generating enzyme family protein [Rubripirellula sp.]
MHLFKSVVVCVAVVAICGCDRGQPTAPVATSTPALATTNNPTPVELPLPESANSIGMKFKLIPAGKFTMGEGDEEYAAYVPGPGRLRHEVTLTKPFKMGVHEVTQTQYEQVMGVNPSRFKFGAYYPVEKVSWDDALEFCRRLSDLPAEKAAGNVYRLPTEAEWEYACRAGTTTKYSFGDDEADLGDYGWYSENSGRTTHPVGGKLPNAWGLYDMHGNAWEWCQDRWDYPSGAVTDPTGPSSGSDRVYRGGSWYYTAGYCRSAHRYRHDPWYRSSNIGFRVSLSPSGK